MDGNGRKKGFWWEQDDAGPGKNPYFLTFCSPFVEHWRIEDD
jgi:hypothetical protein